MQTNPGLYSSQTLYQPTNLPSNIQLIQPQPQPQQNNQLMNTSQTIENSYLTNPHNQPQYSSLFLSTPSYASPMYMMNLNPTQNSSNNTSLSTSNSSFSTNIPSSLSNMPNKIAINPTNLSQSNFPHQLYHPQLLQAQQSLQQQQIIMQQINKISEKVEELHKDLKNLDSRVSSLETVNSQILTYSKHQTVKITQQEDDRKYIAPSSLPPYLRNSAPSINKVHQIDSDEALARQLQDKFNNETPTSHSNPITPARSSYSSPSSSSNKCPICDDSFSSPSALEVHVQTHFSDDEYPKTNNKPEKEEGFLSRFFGSKKPETKSPEPERRARPLTVPPPNTYPAPYYPGSPYQPYPYQYPAVYPYPPTNPPK